jgi:hypothetical protein
MPTKGQPIDEGILARMLVSEPYKMKSKEELILQITQGMSLLEEGEKILDQHMIIRTHFHLPPEEKEALIAAARYRRLAGYDDSKRT